MIIEAIFFKIAFSIKKASAKEREGAGREPCGLRNSELGSLPHCLFQSLFQKKVSSPLYKRKVLY